MGDACLGLWFMVLIWERESHLQVKPLKEIWLMSYEPRYINSFLIIFLIDMCAEFSLPPNHNPQVCFIVTLWLNYGNTMFYYCGVPSDIFDLNKLLNFVLTEHPTTWPLKIMKVLKVSFKIWRYAVQIFINILLVTWSIICHLKLIVLLCRGICPSILQLFTAEEPEFNSDLPKLFGYHLFSWPTYAILVLQVTDEFIKRRADTEW